MTTATTSAPIGIDRAATAREAAGGRARFDPLGLVSGFRAYRIYCALAAKSDAELARMGLERTSIGRAAVDAAFARGA